MHHRKTNWRRLFRLIALALMVTLSLLTFPSSIPWMAAIWVGLAVYSLVRGGYGSPVLVVGATILLVKRIDWPPLLIVLAIFSATILVIELIAWRRHAAWTGRTKKLAASLLGCGWLLFAWDWDRSSHSSRGETFVWREGRTIVCLGDSLTSGDPPVGGYPKVLPELLGRPVVDMGVAGISSSNGVRRLPEVLASRPQIVVLELGGHDFLQGHSRQSLQDNLEQIIVTCRACDAEVVLMEVPRGFVYDAYAGLERQLARQYDLELVADTPIRKLVLWGPFAPPGLWMKESRLSDDGLHPNARGNDVLTLAVATAIRRLANR
ncbi:MAG: GDSL-type esterase/lipase family protein [Pirellulales bacterium]